MFATWAMRLLQPTGLNSIVIEPASQPITADASHTQIRQPRVISARLRWWMARPHSWLLPDIFSAGHISQSQADEDSHRTFQYCIPESVIMTRQARRHRRIASRENVIAENSLRPRREPIYIIAIASYFHCRHSLLLIIVDNGWGRHARAVADWNGMNNTSVIEIESQRGFTATQPIYLIEATPYFYYASLFFNKIILH